MATPASPSTEEKVPRYKYGEDFQRRIVAMLYHDPSVWPQAQEQVKEEYFCNSNLADIVGAIKSFYKENQRPPDLTELTQALDEFLDKNTRPQQKGLVFEYFLGIEEDAAQVVDWEPYKKESVEFAKRQAYATAFAKGIDHLKQDQDYEAIDKEFEQAATVGDGTCGLDVGDGPSLERRKVNWFWWHKIPRGKFSLIAGDPGAGKSWFTLFLAACVSTGRPLPDCHERPTEQGHVLVLSAEDDEEDTILPRFLDAGGDQKYLHILRGLKDGSTFNLERDLAKLASYLQMMKDVRLIVIDPISAYTGSGGKVNTWKASDVMSVLTPFGKVLREHEATAISVLHLNKAKDLDALYRIQGSMAWTGFARAVWLMTQESREKHDSSLRYFRPLKISNASKEQDPLVWRLDEIDEDHVELEFVEDAPPPPTIQEQLSSCMPAHGSKLKEAVEFLEHTLSNGPMEMTAIVRAAAKQGIAESTLRNAKKALGVMSDRGRGDDSDRWFWRLPTEDEKKEWAR